ncbi:hypothetical protein [Brucella sp. JSBI001]|uniref:hypothetical protein n=1 Tax=Brucella sp. JSBI001 TaxID=2886044 RepID=UPI002231F3B4|nr:hypothetical protein [Brucella sp. JSBI001]UZD69365.1 hypothetical protein LJ361_19990 [Brucella sp. JSBI001]
MAREMGPPPPGGPTRFARFSAHDFFADPRWRIGGAATRNSMAAARRATPGSQNQNRNVKK